MPTEYATASDFSRWAELAAGMDSAALHYTIADCRAAAEAMEGWNPIKEGYYRDQLATYAMERSRRQGRA